MGGGASKVKQITPVVEEAAPAGPTPEDVVATVNAAQEKRLEELEWELQAERDRSQGLEKQLVTMEQGFYVKMKEVRAPAGICVVCEIVGRESLSTVLQRGP